MSSMIPNRSFHVTSIFKINNLFFSTLDLLPLTLQAILSKHVFQEGSKKASLIPHRALKKKKNVSHPSSRQTYVAASFYQSSRLERSIKVT